jgi:DNA helicase B
VDVEFFVLDDLSGEIIRPDQKVFLAQAKPRHAWALTIHKFQGSEADTVVYGVSKSSYETWQHVYTAVTRAKKRLIVVGEFNKLTFMLMLID